MFLRTADGESFFIVLQGVKAPALTDVKQGNIILDLVFRSIENIVPADMEELYGFSRDGPPLVRALETAIAERLQVLEINSSYGAHGLVLFETWRIDEQDVQP